MCNIGLVCIMGIASRTSRNGGPVANDRSHRSFRRLGQAARCESTPVTPPTPVVQVRRRCRSMSACHARLRNCSYRPSTTSRLFVNGKVFTGRGEDDFATAFRITDGDIRLGRRPSPISTRPTWPQQPICTAGRWFPDSWTCTPTRRSWPPWSTPSVACRRRSAPSPACWTGYGPTPTSAPARTGGSRDSGMTSRSTRKAAGRPPTISTRSAAPSRCSCSAATGIPRWPTTGRSQLAGITHDTPDPAGAASAGTRNGRLNGLLIETAPTDIVAGAIPQSRTQPNRRRTWPG